MYYGCRECDSEGNGKGVPVSGSRLAGACLASWSDRSARLVGRVSTKPCDYVTTCSTVNVTGKTTLRQFTAALFFADVARQFGDPVGVQAATVAPPCQRWAISTPHVRVDPLNVRTREQKTPNLSQRPALFAATPTNGPRFTAKKTSARRQTNPSFKTVGQNGSQGLAWNETTWYCRLWLAMKRNEN